MMRFKTKALVLVTLLAPSGVLAQESRDIRSAEMLVNVTPQPIRITTPDGRSGWLRLDLRGEVGGTASGQIAAKLGSLEVEYRVREGTLRRVGARFLYTLGGMATVRDGDRTSQEPFSGRIALVQGNALADGDVVVADHLGVCVMDKGDVICI